MTGHSWRPLATTVQLCLTQMQKRLSVLGEQAGTVVPGTLFPGEGTTLPPKDEMWNILSPQIASGIRVNNSLG